MAKRDITRDHIRLAYSVPCLVSEFSYPPSAKEQIQNGHATYNKLHTIHVQSPLVVAPVSVINTSGNFVEDLNKADFRVFDDGVAQRITKCELAAEPVAAVIVIQTNEGLAPLLGAVHPLGPLLSDLLLGGSGQVAVVTYADKVQVVQNFSNEPTMLAATLHGISANGGKARLNDALERAVSMLAARKRAERRVIIVLSEGFDRGSATSGGEVVRSASESNVEIYGLRFNLAKTTFTQDEAFGMFGLNPMPFAVLALQTGVKAMRANVLQQYAGYTGGVVYTHLRERSLQNQLQSIALDINSQYILTYIPTTLQERGFHTIQINVSRPSLQVRTRAGYFYGLPAK